MAKKIRRLLDSIRLEKAMRFINRVASFINPALYNTAAIPGLESANVTLQTLKKAIEDARNALVDAMDSIVRETSDVEQARMSRDTLAGDAIRMMKVIMNNVQSYLILNRAIAKKDEKRIYRDIFSFGPISSVRFRLADFSVIYSTVISGLENYPDIKAAVEYDELLKWHKRLINAEVKYEKETVELYQARELHKASRENFDNVWKVAKKTIKALVANYELSDDIMKNLFAEDDPSWFPKGSKPATVQATTSNNSDVIGTPEVEPFSA